MKNKLFIFLLVAITLMGTGFRLRHIAETPLPGQSQDEYSNAWVGLSLIQLGMPVGMSGVGGNLKHERIYINPDRIFQQTAAGDPMTIAYPWFDHPPLVGVITGSYAYLRGARVFEDVSAAIVRKPAVLFSAMTIFLIGLTGSSWFGIPVGLLAAFFYAISPLATITNKMVQAENFLTPLALFSLFSWWKYVQKKVKIWWYLGTISIMAVVLMKLSGFAFVLAGILLLKQNSKQKWPWLMVGLAGLAAFSWWIFFGMALSPSTFWSVLFGNSERVYGMGFTAVSDLFTSVKITGTKSLADGMITASFISVLVLSLIKVKNKEWVIVPFISFLAIYLFFGGQSYGWYRIPFLPFAFICLAYVTVEMIRTAQIGGAILFLIPLGVSLSKISQVSGGVLDIWRILTLVTVGLGYFYSNKYLSRLILISIIVAAVIATIQYNQKIDANFWYQLN